MATIEFTENQSNCDHTGLIEIDKDGMYDEKEWFFACGKCGKYFEIEYDGRLMTELEELRKEMTEAGVL